MKEIVKLTCAALSIALIANADIDWSAWKHTELGTVGAQTLLRGGDSRYEYRWRSDWQVNRYVCTVEVRPTVDGSIHLTIPELAVVYTPKSRLRRAQVLTQNDVLMNGKLTHSATFTAPDCGSVEAVISARTQP
jgi:hypothetical protein